MTNLFSYAVRWIPRFAGTFEDFVYLAETGDTHFIEARPEISFVGASSAALPSRVVTEYSTLYTARISGDRDVRFREVYETTVDCDGEDGMRMLKMLVTANDRLDRADAAIPTADTDLIGWDGTVGDFNICKPTKRFELEDYVRMLEEARRYEIVPFELKTPKK